MVFGRLPGHRPAAAIQQPKIAPTLEQAEEMLSRITRFINAQHTALINLGQQPLHAIQHALGPGLEKDQREFRVLAAEGDHQAVQVHGFVAVDQLMKAVRDIQQHRFNRNPIRQFEKQRRQLLFALGDHGGGEQRFLVVEVAVDSQLGHTCLSRHGIHAGVRVTLAHKQNFRRIEDGLALGQILGAARTAGC